jgi:hypothetical protein
MLFYRDFAFSSMLIKVSFDAELVKSAKQVALKAHCTKCIKIRIHGYPFFKKISNYF